MPLCRKVVALTLQVALAFCGKRAKKGPWSSRGEFLLLLLTPEAWGSIGQVLGKLDDGIERGQWFQADSCDAFFPGDFMRNVYEDLMDMAVLKMEMERGLGEYNRMPGVVPMRLVLFRDAIEHSE